MCENFVKKNDFIDRQVDELAFKGEHDNLDRGGKENAAPIGDVRYSTDLLLEVAVPQDAPKEKCKGNTPTLRVRFHIKTHEERIKEM